MAEPSSKISKVMGPASKFFKDSIHGTIEMEPILVAIIDTPQFQRLRDIKQLGVAYWVYPGACHNRLEHCIGTSHLCGLMLSTLQSLHEGEKKHIPENEYIEITEKDILCVKIAGLIHDLGHGPFSHVFDSAMNKIENEKTDSAILPRNEDETSKWTHEKASCNLFDDMFKSNPYLVDIFKAEEIGDQERDMIKYMIMGGPPKDLSVVVDDTIYKGKTYKKQFLYEIVSNKATGIDCDKFDYFSRDTHHVGIKNSFDFHRYFKNVRIMPIEKTNERNENLQLRICARDKEESNLYEMFHMRWTLHRQVYQHKTVVLIAEFVTQAFILADKGGFGIFSSIGKMERYTYLTDSIFYEILRYKDADKDIVAARELLKRVQRRDLYLYCGEIVLRKIEVKDGSLKIENVDDLVKDIEEMMKSKDINRDVFLHRACFDYGKEDKNPLNEMKFFDKAGSIKERQLKDSDNNMLPKNFEEKRVRVYCKSKEKDVQKLVKSAFHEWCEEKGHTVLY